MQENKNKKIKNQFKPRNPEGKNTPFVKKNQFWRLRTKHGRDKLIENPELLWESACEYFEYVENNPFITEETTVKERHVEHKEVKHKRPFTWEGLELYLGLNSLRYYKTAESHKDFSQVISLIEKVIYSQKFEGASAGIFNANIIARDLGLIDKSEQKQEIEKKIIRVGYGKPDND